MEESELKAWAQQAGHALMERGMRIATAESCTGGLIAATLTSIAGSSDWVECAFVTYTLNAKSRLLGVRPETLAHHGPVSEPTAKEMALGALRNSMADMAVSVTGIAGPGGGEILHPVGTVWFGWALRSDDEPVFESGVYEFHGTREEVRRQAVCEALKGVVDLLNRSL